MTNSTQEITTLQVGERFPVPMRMQPGQDMACALEMFFDKEGRFAQLMLVQSIKGITPTERLILDREKINTRIYMQNNQMIFLFRYGNTPLMLETTFDASLYKRDIVEDILSTDLSNLITIVRVDPVTNNIEALRAASLPKQFRNRLLQSINTSEMTPNFTHQYKEWIFSVWSKYNNTQLWQLAESTGFLGE